MEALAVGLLLFMLGNLWGVFIFLFKKMNKIEHAMHEISHAKNHIEERLGQVEVQVDGHEGRLCNLEENN